MNQAAPGSSAFAGQGTARVESAPASIGERARQELENDLASLGAANQVPAPQSAPGGTPATRPSDVSLSSPDASTSDPEQLIASLLEIVSERTGYPPDMLDPALDLEADLGIDSIKRVEILNSFRKILPLAKQQQMEGGIEELAGTKTLQGIMDWLRADATGTGLEASGQAAATVVAASAGGLGATAAKSETGARSPEFAPEQNIALQPITSVVSRAVVNRLSFPPA